MSDDLTEHMAELVLKFNNWLKLMGSNQAVSVAIDTRYHTIVSVEVIGLPATKGDTP